MPPAARTVATLLFFAAGLVSSTALLRQVAARNPSPTHGALEHLAAKGGEYDVLVIGPSFVQLHFLPQVFDDRMKELGHPVRSFGFGMSGLRGGELDYYLERVLELPMPKLKHLLCDVTVDQLRALEQGNAYKRRVIYWHGLSQLEFIWHVIQKRTEDPALRAEYAWRHVQHVMLKAANVGEGVEALRKGSFFAQPRIRARRSSSLSPKQLEEERKRGERYAKKHGKRFERGERRLKKIREQLAQAGRGKPGKHRGKPKKPRENTFARYWADRIAARGVDPVFVLSPVLGYYGLDTHVPNGEPLRVLDFNDPRRYPELYDPMLHADQSHFHYEGAVLFSKRLAEAFAADLDARAPRTPARDDRATSTAEAD